jgi:hypothetical protein
MATIVAMNIHPILLGVAAAGPRPRSGSQALLRHVIVPETTQIVNQAAVAVTGDGIPEVAYESSFAMQAANSRGLV